MLQAPRVFAKEWQAHSSPVVAIVSLTITTGILVNFSFQQLVVYDVCRVCAMMLSDVLSWCWLAGPVLQRNRHLRSGRVCLLPHTPTRSPPAFPCFGYVSCLAVCVEMLSLTRLIRWLGGSCVGMSATNVHRYHGILFRRMACLARRVRCRNPARRRVLWSPRLQAQQVRGSCGRSHSHPAPQEQHGTANRRAGYAHSHPRVVTMHRGCPAVAWAHLPHQLNCSRRRACLH